MIFRSFREDDIEPFVVHCTEIFPGVEPGWFRDHYMYDPDRNLDAMFLAEEDGRIISTAQVFSREMYVKGFPVTVGAMGDVTTLEEYRMRGINKRLLQMSIDFMVENDIATSMLYTDKLDYYAKFGWFTVCRRSVAVDLAGADRLPAGYELSPFAEGDLKQAEELYHLCAKRFDGAYTRKNPEYWSRWAAHYLIKPMALKRGGEMAAWMDTKLFTYWFEADWNRQSEYLILGDYASRPGEDWFLPMMAEYSRTHGGPSKGIVPAPLMPGHNGAFREDRNNMFRLNKPFILGDQRIGSAGDLAAVLSDTLFWQTDAY